MNTLKESNELLKDVYNDIWEELHGQNISYSYGDGLVYINGKAIVTEVDLSQWEEKDNMENSLIIKTNMGELIVYAGQLKEFIRNCNETGADFRFEYGKTCLLIFIN
jgi:hypothetical protein